jgi:hypothetical protein
MIVVTQPKPHRLSLQERILAMRPETIATTLPVALRASGAFSERDIALTVGWGGDGGGGDPNPGGGGVTGWGGGGGGGGWGAANFV